MLACPELRPQAAAALLGSKGCPGPLLQQADGSVAPSACSERSNLTSKPAMQASRVTRIARGSGHAIPEVLALLEEHKRLAKMFQGECTSYMRTEGSGMPAVIGTCWNAGRACHALKLH